MFKFWKRKTSKSRSTDKLNVTSEKASRRKSLDIEWLRKLHGSSSSLAVIRRHESSASLAVLKKQASSVENIDIKANGKDSETEAKAECRSSTVPSGNEGVATAGTESDGPEALDMPHVTKISSATSSARSTPTSIRRSYVDLPGNGENPRPRESQRRRTTVVTYNPQSSRLLDQDDVGTMSDVEPSTFQRGGVARASLPIVRSASSSLERPIGLVFLMFGEETKKSLLPNEITSLDTVRALFVRAFPDKLSMEFLDSPKRKIYILEAATNIFFQLEDLRDVQDRAVLKIHECDSEEPQRVRSQPESRGRAVQQVLASSRPVSRQGYASDGSTHYDQVAKAQSLPVAGGGQPTYQDLMLQERAQWEMEQQDYLQQAQRQRRSRSRSHTPELAERPRSLSTGAPRNRYSHSPEHLATPERGGSGGGGPHPLNPIPENPRLLANGFRQAAALNGSHYEVLPGGRSQHHPQHAHPHAGPPGRVLSPPTVGQPIYESVYQAGGGGHGYHHPQSYVTHSMRATMPQGPQRATGPTSLGPVARNDPGGRHSLAFAAMSNPIYESFPPQRTQSYRTVMERDLLPPRPQSTAPREVHRMERMEAQIASLAAWVHQVHASPTESARRGPGSSRSTSSGHSEGTDTYPGSTASKENGDGGSISASPGLSDIPATYSLRPPPVVSVEMREKMNDMRCRLKEFRVELQGLRRMEQLNQETMRDAFSEARYRIKTLTGPPGGLGDAQGAVQMLTCSPQAQAYLQDKAKAETELRGCEVRMDALKEDMLTRGSPISASDIEGQALHLTHITKALAGLKARCPQVQESLKSGSSGEAQDGHEQFLSEESSYIEAALKRCKTLTTNLVTLKRIVTAQDTSSSSPAPSLTAEVKSEDEEDTMAILEHLRAMMPDCQARLLSQEAVHSQAGRSEADSRRPSGSAEVTDSVKCEPPQVPAKPARLLTASEIKQMSAATGTVATAASHTVTVTSQIADHNNDSASPTDRQSARSVFFSSMQSPPTSPPPSVSDRSSRRLPTASRSSAVSSSSSSTSTSSSVSPSVTSPSHSKSGSGIYYQAVSPTKSRSAFSSIPLPSRPDKEDYSSKSSDKGKKVPPPPPPRTSSARLSFSSLPSPNANGGIAGRRNSGDKSPDPRGKRDSALAVYKATSPTSPGSRSGVGGQKMNKFQKDIAAGIYANLNRPDLQHQNLVPDRLISNIACPAPAALVTNSQDPQLEEGELSGSESTGSSTSLDSQQGLGLTRANSAASSRGPKPSPPQRHSSLSGRGSLSEESGGKTKTQMLQERVRKSQEAGARRASGGGGGGGGSSQVNGVDSARNGHKT